MRNVHGVLHFCAEAHTALRVTMQDQEAGGVLAQVLGQAQEGATGGAADAHVAVQAQAQGATVARWALGDVAAYKVFTFFSLPGSLS